MSDPLRSDLIHAQSAADPERDAKIESLLLAGLDHYFSSDYAQAIDIWTRALFLDRNHARARAYIERARSALAEQQRESEEMVECGIAAFERGDMDAARRLLNAAVERGGAHDVALAFLTRIDRLNAAAPGIAPAETTITARTQVAVVTAPAPCTRGAWVVAGLAAAVLLAVGYGLVSVDRFRSVLPSFVSDPDPVPAAVSAIHEPIVIPHTGDVAMDRARALSAVGRMHDALRALDLVRPSDARRPDADRLKESIQRTLLAHGALPQ